MNPERKSRPRRSIAVDFALWGSLSLISVGVVLGAVNYFVAPLPLRQELNTRASAIARGFARVLHEAIWNLDDDTIAGYFATHPNTEQGLVVVRVLTEYEDPIFEKHYRSESDPIRRRAPVYHQEQLIGFVEVGLSRDAIARSRRAARTFMLLMVAVGTASLLFITNFVMQRKVVKPLQQMMAEVLRVARGDYEAERPVYRHHEIDQVSRHVHHMATKIAQRTRQLETEIEERKLAQDALEHLKAILEDQVKQRTAALAAANRRLREEAGERRQAEHTDGAGPDSTPAS